MTTKREIRGKAGGALIALEIAERTGNAFQFRVARELLEEIRDEVKSIV